MHAWRLENVLARKINGNREMNYKLFSHTLALVLLGVAVLAAQAQSLRYVGGGSMGGNKFQLVYELSEATTAGSLTPPHVEGANLIMASSPQKIGESSSTVFVNGKMVQNSHGSTYRYTCTYKAQKEGRLSIGPASVSVGGKRVQASGFSFNVGSGAAQAPSAASQISSMAGGPVNMNNPFTQTADKPISSNDLYVRIEMSRPRVYEQQAVVCTIKLYTKFPIRPEIIPLKQPSFTGFLIEEIKEPGQVNVERVNGQNYFTAVLKRCILYPQKSGVLTINSGEFDITPIQRDVYVGLNSAIAVPHDTKLRVKSNSASVNILQLPEPRPAGFTGAVGNFSVKTLVKPQTLKTFAAATYSYVVSGSGNIKYIKSPSIQFPSEFDAYDPQSDIQTSAEGGDVRGTVTFNYQFIPQYVGRFKIPAGDFVFFNPNTGRYETIHIAASELNVAKGAGKPSSHYKQMLGKMTDIHGLKMGDLNLSKTHTFYIDEWIYWLGWIIPLFTLVGILIYYRKLVRERANEKLMRTKRASKVAQRRLKRARKFMTDSNTSAFYAEVLTASWGYLSDKLGIPVSELSKENIDAELEKYGVDESLRVKTLGLLDKCEFAQYAPQLANSDMNAVFSEAAAVMDALESVKRKKTVES